MACKPLNISANHLAGVVYDVNRFLGICFPKPDFGLSVLVCRVNPTVFPEAVRPAGVCNSMIVTKIVFWTISIF
jgi:hypothetical protein